MQKIRPYLWFNDQAEEAMNFYISIFKDSKTGAIARFSGDGPGAKGKVMSVTFTLAGQEFIALNGGPMFKFSPATSFFVTCDTQDEIDYFWEKLSEGGEKQRCGWLKDKFGLSWQVVPKILGPMIADPDSAKSSKVIHAMMEMDKLVIAPLEQAYTSA